MTSNGALTIAFARPDIGEEELEAVAETIRSGWLTSGPGMEAFESEFRSYLGGQVEVLAVQSATAGLHLALEALGIGPSDEVIVPTWTFTATAEVVRYLGATPVIVDVDPDTLNISLDAVEAAITPHTKGVIPVHFGGLPVDMRRLRAIADRHGLVIIEDAAHAFPASLDGNMVGDCAHSDATVFSFYATKPLVMGEGGAVTTRLPEVARRIRVMRLHGIDRDVFNRFTAAVRSWQYDVVAPGFKYNLSDLHASIGRVQLRRTPVMHDRRRAIAKRYFDELGDMPLMLPAEGPSGATHAWHLFVIRLLDQASVSRGEFIDRMAEAGIGTSVHYRPLHEHSYWKSLHPQWNPGTHYPHAAAAASRAVSLPLSSALTDDDVTRITSAARTVLA